MDSRESSRFDDERVNRRRILLAVIAAVALFLIGVLVGRSLAPEVSDPSTEGPPANRGTSQATGENTEEGAVTAATTFARIMTGPSGDEETYRDAVLSIAAPRWRERASDLAENSVDFVQERYGEGGAIRFYPVRYHLDVYSREGASVDIWGLVLASGPKLAGIEESWITATLHLLWIENRWKVRGQSSSGGPTPELLKTGGGAALPDQLQGFEEYEDAPRP